MFYIPQDDILKKYIQCIWIINHDSIPSQTKMLPDGYSDMMINLGDPYRISYNNESLQWVSESVYFGQRTKTLKLDQPGNVKMIGIRLHPGTEFSFIGIPAFQVKDKSIDLKIIFGLPFMEMLKTLKECNDTARQLILIETLLLGFLKSKPMHSDEKTTQAIAYIHQHNGTITTSELVSHLDLNYKSCERLFKKHLGLTPNTYIRIVRFYNTFVQIRAKDRVNWTELLRKFNYYDQSHFIKDYHYFTGASPGKQFAMKDTLDEVFKF